MNIKKVPNILCVIRVVMIPFILLFLLDNPFSELFTIWVRLLVAGILFGLAMLTDLFDGKIARKYDAITNFGKFLDPIADKLLVIAVMLAFVEKGLISSVPVVIILAREFLVTGLRLGAMGHNVVVPANMWGKVKTMFQGISLGLSFLVLFIAALLSPEITEIGIQLSYLPAILAWLNAAITGVSGISYYNQMKEYIK